MSFQVGGTKLERFLPKNQHTQRKLWNWCNGDSDFGFLFLWKCFIDLTFKVNFLCQKSSESFSIFFCIEEYQFRSTFFCYLHFLITTILKSLYFQSDAQFLTPPHNINSIFPLGMFIFFPILYLPLENSTTRITITSIRYWFFFFEEYKTI